MSFMKSAMLGSAAVIVAAAGAQAADLPSKKAAPATYVKICDAYGAGFFYIPGSDTCVKLGGYVRAEYQYVPATTQYSATTGAVTQAKGVVSTTGYEMRGRIDVDARTPTAMGVARTFVRLRAANTSGIRNAVATADKGTFDPTKDASTTSISIESAMVQWAGFTFGVAPENYAMMPSVIYNANPWAGFPNGMKQLAYTATLGGGVSATLALEDRQDFGYAKGATAYQTVSTGGNVVANVRMDQAWGFAAVHGLVGNNSLDKATLDSSTTVANGGDKTFSSYSVGTTVSFKLPMLAAGDQVWFTANYAKGALGGLLSDGGLSVLASASAKRINGGVIRVDTNLVKTSSVTAAGVTTTTYDSTTGFNVAGLLTHYWTSQWRSNLSAGYVEFNPPTSAIANTWGKGKLWEVAGSIIYSPAKDFDIGLEVQYANLKSTMQNAGTTSAWAVAGTPGLSVNNYTTKLRVERQF